MAVLLSPYGGVGAQFLDNSGNVLTGGKIFTYAAGTTTPQITYTNSTGTVPHSNPIILDAAGRVPGGEIWLTDGLAYKFVLTTSTDVLIATYDNIVGINSNFVAFSNQQEIQTATAGQTVFNLTTMVYQPGTNSLSVFVDGVNQYGPGASYAYIETDSDTVTFTSGLHVGAEVKFTTSNLNSSASLVDAKQISYLPPYTGSVATNVEAKLAQYISTEDFGAVGDGVTDDTSAIRAAATAANASGIPLMVNPGTYFINSPADIDLNVSMSAIGAVFKMGSGMGTTTMFRVNGNALQDITSNVTLSQFAQNRTTINSLAPYRNGLIKILSDVPNVKRFPSDITVLPKQECNYVTKGGVLVTPIRHDYTTGGTGVTQVFYRKDQTQQLVISGGAVDLNGKANARFLLVQRNDVKINKWTVLDSAEVSKIDTALLFRAVDCANFVMEDISGDAMNQAVSASFSYLVLISFVFNAQFCRYFAHGGWGSFQASDVNGYHITDSNFDRFDIHYNGFDMTIDNCMFYGAAQYGSGGGVLSVTNSTKIVKQITPFLSNVSSVSAVVGTRGDYGGFWEGSLQISNVAVVVSLDYVVSVANSIKMFISNASGDFGAGRALPDPYSIVIRDCVVQAPNSVLTNSSFGVWGIYLDNGKTFSGNPGVTPPQRSVVDNLFVNNPSARTGSVTELLIESSYASSIAVGTVLPRLVNAFGSMNSVRGIGAIDLQIEASSNTRIASGNYSVISGGISNEANGNYSWIPGGAYATTRQRNGSWAFGSNPTNNLGRYQASGIVLQASTPNNTPLRMTSDAVGSTANTTNQFTIPTNSLVVFEAMVAARGNASVGKGWKVTGLARNNAGTLTLVSAASVTVVAESPSATSWGLAVTADNTLKCLAFDVTGDALSTVFWTAHITAVEQTS